ncbi:PIG-L family deacetylase [Leucobacter sp. W1478]|uniref:PIG-L family deacetylase n=1 Tax=Leucobacter sp. W1478 TaxID=3439065 RepID=UPI003F2E515D
MVRHSEEIVDLDPITWFDGARRVLFVHAHPDDETITTGGTLAALSEAGAEPGLVTLTRGERGEVTQGPFASLAGTDRLAAHRETELAAALFMLGVDRHAYLGTPPARAADREPRTYVDSGMSWGQDGFATASPDASVDALTRASVIEPLNDLLALAAEWAAEAVVSYDASGGYGHPDHVFAHRLGRAVAHGLELPFWEIVTEGSLPGEAGVDLDVAEADEAVEGPTALVAYDVGPWNERKLAALRSHATQLTVDGDTIVHVGGQRQPIELIERYRRLPQLR